MKTKKLIVSCKTVDQVFDDFKRTAKSIKEGKFSGAPHFELSFDNKADFNRFVRNIPMLSAILTFEPKSVYELSKITGQDVSNLNKVIHFFEESGVIDIKESLIAGRKVRRPIVAFDEVTFRLAA